MTRFDPYANEADCLILGSLRVENRTDRITLTGDIDLTRDREGLANARLLRDVLDDAVRRLESESLPAQLPPPARKTTKNPFGS